ncbi:ubiquinone/menaquinone biosynthesis C-methylase UbiE [Methanolinea mesophila]|nr:ubiquinone/menaquinone biosynthesis C-methylase UbiE [Methanolinea mesophila]
MNDELQKYYDNYYSKEENKSEWRDLGAIDKVNNIVELCGKYPHEKILEIGSGEGAILKRLSDLKFGKELCSLEISSSGINSILKKNIPTLKEVIIFDGYDIPYTDKEFDLVILSHVIEHVEHPRKLLYEATRVGKFIFIEVPLDDTIRLKEQHLNKSGHINFYSLKTIKMLLRSCNLKILNYSVTNISYPVRKYLSGNKALIYYPLTEFCLKIFPNLAPVILPYHCALIAEQE